MSSSPSRRSHHWFRTRALRDESGQGLVEWAGVLVVVAIVVIGVAKFTGVAPAAVHGMRHQVCTIFSGSQNCSTETSTTPTATSTTGGYPTTGVPITQVPGIPILPFNGATVTACVGTPKGVPVGGGGEEDPGDEGSGDDGDGGASGSFKVKVCDNITDTRGDPTLTALCTETQQLTLSSDLNVTVKGGVEAKGVGVSATVGGGAKTTYQLNVTPSQVDQMKNGTLGQPNPLDPRTIPSGDSLVMSQSTYDEMDLGASYRALNASLGYQSGHQISTGVKSLGDGELQIDVGDSDLVQNSMSLGVDIGPVGASLGDTDSESYGKLRQVDVDINTPAGWATYQQFLQTGTLPSTADAGVSEPATQTVYTDADQVKAEAHLFGLSFGVSGQPDNLTDTETKTADGTDTISFSYREGDVTEVVNTTRDADGTTEPSSYQMLLHNVGSTEVKNYEQVAGGSDDPSGNQDLIMNFTPDQLNALQYDADSLVAYYDKNYGAGGPTTAAGVKAYLADHPDAELGGMNLRFEDMSIYALATAKGPDGIMQALQDGSWGNSSGFLDSLEAFELGTLRYAHPGNTGYPLTDGVPGTLRDCGQSS